MADGDCDKISTANGQEAFWCLAYTPYSISTVRSTRDKRVSVLGYDDTHDSVEEFW